MEKVINSIEYGKWLREQARLRRPYWYGCYYNECTEALLQRKAKQYPSHYTAKRMPTYREHIAEKQIAGDCVNGAIKGAIWSELGTRRPEYASHGCPDKSADGMFEYCKSLGMPWGSIGSMPDRPNMIAVRFAGHVGVYVGNGEVVEWRGFDYRCVLTKLKGRPWTHWYELPWVIDGNGKQPELPEIGGIPDVGELGSRLLKRGSKGEDVRMLQQLLMQIGYELPEYGDDGDFGAETETAVKKFQRVNGLEADGKYGNLTHAELMGIMAEQAAQDDDDDDALVAPRRRVIVTGGTVNVRKGPGKTYDPVTVVRKGARYELVATADNGWHSIILTDGRNVWISPIYSEVEE